MDKVRMGIIGMGNMGCQYAEMIAHGLVPGMELAAVTRIRKERMDWARKTLPGSTAVYQTAEELFACGGMNAVLIATPHYAHQEQAVEAMKRGLHVLCEKPAGVYARQAREMSEAAQRCGIVYSLMFQQRTNPFFQKIRELVNSGRYGRLKRVNWIVTDWYRPDYYYKVSSWHAAWATDGGGVLLNQCPHNLDILQWICGMPVRIQAFCHEGKYHPIEVEDEVTAYMEFPDGATGTFITSTGEAPGTNRLEITLEDGRILYEKGKLEVCELGVHEPEYRRTARELFTPPPCHVDGVEPEGENLQYVGILRNFADAVLCGTPLLVKGSEGINSLQISNAMYLSSWQKRMVELPVDEAEFEKELKKRQKTP